MSVKYLGNNACFIAVLSLLSFISSNEGSFLPKSYNDAAGIRHVRTQRSYDYDSIDSVIESVKADIWRRVKKEQDAMKRQFYADLAVEQSKMQQLRAECSGVMGERTQLSEKNKQLEEMYKKAQQELSEERSRNSDVKTQMDTVRKDLDACKAQLPILQQEKESLRLKIKDEVTRNEVFQQDKSALVEAAVNETIKSQTVACESTLRTLTENHNAKVAACELESKRLDNEYLKASDLGMKYMAERDSLAKEKLELSTKHSDELEKYKTLLREATSKNDGPRENCDKSLEETSNKTREELTEECSKCSEFREEMEIVKKDLVACKVELPILQREKKALQVKMTNEITRCGILEQDRIALSEAVTSGAKNSEGGGCEFTLKKLIEKHNAQVAAYEAEFKRAENEYFKASDLGFGYMEERDALLKEKREILKKHADELEKCKNLTREADTRYENLKVDCDKSLQKNKRYEKIGDAHREPDKCEVALFILRQETKNLQSKIDEEVAKNRMMDQNKAALVKVAYDAMNSEKVAREELKKLENCQDPLRSEIGKNDRKKLRVPTTKPMDCQEQLHAAQLASQAQLETKQHIIDAHQLDTDLLEEIHKEKARLNGMKLAEALQKAAALEARLNSQCPEEKELAKQLESPMHRQCLQIIQAIAAQKAQDVASLQRAGIKRIFPFPDVIDFRE